MPQLADREMSHIMQSETVIDFIRESDPNAISLVTENRDVFYVVKRIIDIIMALSLLLILSPLMVLISILIVLYSPGPVFFVQDRVGAIRQRHGNHTYWQKKNFRCYKFRTMRTDADTSIHKAYMRALIENDQKKMDEFVQTYFSTFDNMYFTGEVWKVDVNTGDVVATAPVGLFGKFYKV